MRLVRDEPIEPIEPPEPVESVESIDDNQDDVDLMGDEQDETTVTDHADEATPRRARKSRGRKRESRTEDSDERPDGSVTDDADESPLGESASADVSEPQASSDDRDGRDDRDEVDVASATDLDLQALEALLFSTHHPLTAGRLAELLDLETTKPIRAAIKQLNEQYDRTSRAFRIEQVAGGYQLLTLPTFGELLKKFHQKEGDAKLTKAALETLAIIAYKQPILRADVEAIRGVACGETIRSLMEKHLVKIAGRAEEPGRPILYGTTKRFLELFGLNSLKELPQNEESKVFAPPPQAPRSAPVEPPPTTE
jgi:segregation and condensation protein B